MSFFARLRSRTCELFAAVIPNCRAVIYGAHNDINNGE